MSQKLEQIYGRDGKIFYWSPADGEVCVDLSLNTPSSVLLSRCDDGEPIYMIRRFEPLWSKVAWVFYKPEQLTKKERRGGWTGLDVFEHIYRRDGKVYYWNTDLGEYEVRPKWDGGLGGYLLLTNVPRATLRRGYRLPDLPLIDDTHPLWYDLRAIMKKQHNPKSKSRKKPKKNPVKVRDLVRKAMR